MHKLGFNISLMLINNVFYFFMVNNLTFNIALVLTVTLPFNIPVTQVLMYLKVLAYSKYNPCFNINLAI